MSLLEAYNRLRERQIAELTALREQYWADLNALSKRHHQERYEFLIRSEAENTARVTGASPPRALPEPQFPLPSELPAHDSPVLASPVESITTPPPQPVTRRCFWCGKKLPKHAKANQKFCSNKNVCKMAYHRNPAKRKPRYAAWWDAWSRTSEPVARERPDARSGAPRPPRPNRTS